MRYITNEIVYGVPDWMNRIIFRGSKKQIEGNLLKIFKLWR